VRGEVVSDRINLTYLVSLTHVAYDPVSKLTIESSNFRLLEQALTHAAPLAGVYFGLGYFSDNGGSSKVLVTVASTITKAQKLIIDALVGVVKTSPTPSEKTADERDSSSPYLNLIPQEPRLPNP